VANKIGEILGPARFLDHFIDGFRLRMRREGPRQQFRKWLEIGKLVGFYLGNAGSGIPTHFAMILLFRPETGEPLAVMDGRLMTEMRMAAVSLAVTKRQAAPATRVSCNRRYAAYLEGRSAQGHNVTGGLTRSFAAGFITTENEPPIIHGFAPVAGAARACTDTNTASEASNRTTAGASAARPGTMSRCRRN
jgi:hypothetical protein